MLEPAEMLVIDQNTEGVGLRNDGNGEFLARLETHASVPFFMPPASPEPAVSHNAALIEPWVEMEEDVIWRVSAEDVDSKSARIWGNPTKTDGLSISKVIKL